MAGLELAGTQYHLFMENRHAVKTKKNANQCVCLYVNDMHTRTHTNHLSAFQQNILAAAFSF